ncbi:MAG: UDP-N-acetylmuramate dehydrogenase [Treponema sp.]|jgi:UDP-N-acetylmuramate dehydrogenase|nr:UDP-N-acetylmuramate dehydrogenase [Treponema sp.]
MRFDEFARSCLLEGWDSSAIRYNEPMAEHTTFKTGGQADIYIGAAAVKQPQAAAALLRYAYGSGIPVQIIGGGANIVVADGGIRGITLDTRLVCKYTPSAAVNEGVLIVPAGLPSDEAAERAAEHSLSGLEFFAGLPGTVGGAVWMNARCWGKEVSGVLRGVELLNESYETVFEPFNAGDWAYKKSPYQARKTLILAAHFNLSRNGQAAIRKQMTEYRLEREVKGHFRYPSAGSVFKNNPDFGKSAGKIIDELGLRGMQVGGARIADWHGNFIINTGGAISADIRMLAAAVQAKVRRDTGINLESEILFIGDWQPAALS